MTVITEIKPDEAWGLLQKHPEAVLLDVRTSMEFEYVGHPIEALHIPWKEAPDWKTRPDFTAEVKRALSNHGDQPVENIPVLALCRSGKRSLAAAQELANVGFTDLYNVIEGFEGDLDENKHRNTINGWRFRGLPWIQG